MSGMKHSDGSASTRRARRIKLAPMTRAVRMALAASVAALALGAATPAFAAGPKVPLELQLSQGAIPSERLPVIDLTTVPMFSTAEVPVELHPTAISQYSPGDVSIYNDAPISESDVFYDMAAISGYSDYGAVEITNTANGELYAGSVFGDAIGIYGYSLTGDVSIDNAGDITAYSYAGLADGIFASGANVEVANSGAIESYGYTWSAGIEAQGADSVVVDNSGDITAYTGPFVQVVDGYGYTIGYSAGGTAYGIYATGGEAGASVTNSGNIEVQGGYVTGIEVQSSGDLVVDNSGGIVAGSGLNSYYNGSNYYTYYFGTQVATGINATSNGEGAAVSVSNSGDISADGIFGATGIAATASGYGGSASVTNSGAIYASQNQKYGYGAYGIVVSSDGDGSIDNSGSIEVYSGGVANGATVLSFAGDASVTNSGDISVYSAAAGYYGATGITAFAANGSAHVDNSGSVDASAKYWATGVNAQAYGDVTVDNSGSLYADGQKYAFGVYAASNAGDVVVHNEDGGEIGFYSYLGRGWGVFAYAGQGDVHVDNGGTIAGYAYGQSAGVFGLAGAGNVSVDNSGTIDVVSGGGTAVGVFARADYGTASVSNSGDITASVGSYYYSGFAAYGVLARGAYAEVSNSGNIVAEGYYYATGIAATSYYGTLVHNTGGSISAYALGGATGIDALSLFGDVVVDNASDIEAVGLVFGAQGLRAYSVYGDVEIHNTGDIYAGSLYGDAIGIYGYSLTGDVSIDNAGDITAYSYAGLADGIFASGANVEVANSGAIESYGYTWSAGIEAQGADSVVVDNSGDITAYTGPFVQVVDGYGYTIGYSAGGTAYGIYATGGEAGASVTNSGNIEVQGGYVTGIEVQSSGDLVVDNSGGIVAGSGLNSYYNGSNYYTYYFGTQVATGINATSNGEGAAVSVSNSGDISADGIFGATGIAATASGYGGSASVTNSGAIYASQNQKYGYGAYGIVVSSDGDGSIDNSGSIEVYSGGVANGATVLSFAGDASVTNSGDISVYSAAAGYYGATGITAFAANGSAYVGNSGSVSVTSAAILGAATRAVDAQGQQGVVVVNSGSLYANGKYAYGVYALSTAGDVAVHNEDGGEIGFYSYSGTGFGVLGISYLGDVDVDNAGSIEGYAYGQSVGVFGFSGDGDVSVHNSGSISAVTGGNAAVGVFARADYGTASVSNSGDIYAGVNGVNGYIGDVAYGVLARGEYADVGNSGSIEAVGFYYATGIAARSYYGTTIATSASSQIEATALLVATGIEGRVEFGNVVVANAGDIMVEGVYGGGVGIQAYAYFGSVSVANAGDILAGSTYGTAIGVTGAVVFGNTVVSNSGTIEAAGYYGAYGIAAQSYFGDVTVSNSSSGHVHAAAPGYAYGVFASAYGDVTINNAGDVSASADDGGSAAAVLMESLYGHSTLNNAATGSISVEGTDGYAFAVVGSDAVDTINNSGHIYGAISLLGGNDAFNNRAGGLWDVDGTVSTDFGDGNDTLGNAGSVRIDDGGAISFGAGDDSINNLAGGVIRLAGGSIYMGAGNDGILNLGTIAVAGDDNLIDLGGGAQDVLTNVNTINFLDGHTDDALAIHGNLGGTGSLGLDVDLADESSDQLYVEGSMVSNAAQRVNIAFAGMPLVASTSIDFAHVSGTSAAGSFVPGQILGYNYARNFLDLAFTIGSRINTANTADDVFSIELDVVGLNDTGTLAANVASGAAGMLNAQVGTFKQRMGVNPYGDDGKVMSAFFRTYTSEGDVDPAHMAANFGQGGNFAFDQTTWGREVGVNANLHGNFHAGVTLGSADGRQRLTGNGVGENRMDGMTWGWYATWFAPQGFYVDLSGRWMAVDVRSTSAAGQLESRAHTGAWNLEAGYQWTLAGLSVVPQLQYTRTEVEDVRTIYGDRANFEGHGGTSSRGRLGVEISKTFESGDMRWTPYGSLNAIREFDGEMSYTVADNFFGSTDTEGTSVMAELGLGVQKGGWGFTIGANWADGGAFQSTVSGQALVRFAW